MEVAVTNIQPTEVGEGEDLGIKVAALEIPVTDSEGPSSGGDFLRPEPKELDRIGKSLEHPRHNVTENLSQSSDVSIGSLVRFLASLCSTSNTFVVQTEEAGDSRKGMKKSKKHKLVRMSGGAVSKRLRWEAQATVTPVVEHVKTEVELLLSITSLCFSVVSDVLLIVSAEPAVVLGVATEAEVAATAELRIGASPISTTSAVSLVGTKVSIHSMISATPFTSILPAATAIEIFTPPLVST
ncbi:uncharacterized protein A4U43_C03F27260 [Asparagus officinalis]|uniref:Uncharacterized protein n=1 Tax=Asparagus officinalis TaxID=4686 RepID=A0A5P1FDF3_ASPOF|nr:uncharacterized protein A4U43_C03F27260 [Asparagus officinalis]